MYIAVYCGSVSGNQEIYTEKAALFGRWMAEQGMCSSMVAPREA